MDLKQLKTDFILQLHEAGIPDFQITLKEYKKNPKGYLGCYRGMSQFRSRPIICLDVEAHAQILKEQERFSEQTLHGALMETLWHEYGHVIEEFVHFTSRNNPDKTILNKLNEFEDMEDFAESFARWRTGREFYLDEEIELFKEITNYYVEKVFTPDSIAWVRQEFWKRELDSFLDIHKKSFDQYDSLEGSFNKCLKVCEAVGERIQNKNFDLKIVRLEGYKGNLSNAHPKWKKMESFFIVHYVLQFNDKWIIDLTSKQFNAENPKVLMLEKEELGQLWDQISIHHEYNQTSKPKFR